jgi:hypothetical protein
MRHLAPCSLLVLLTTACASGVALPGQVAAEPDTQISDVYSGYSFNVRNDDAGSVQRMEAPVQRVQAALPEVLRELGIPEVGADPSGRVYGNRNVTVQRLGGQPSTAWVRCGSDGGSGATLASRYRTVLSVLVTLKPEGDATLLNTQVSGTGTTLGGTNSHAVQCSSNGRLETRVAEMLAARLADTQ